MSAVIALDVRNLSKRYRGGVNANEAISLTVDAGEVMGVFGPNGAGKTTLVRQILGLTRPTAGHVLIGGRDITHRPDRARQLCSYQPQAQVPLNSLKPRRAIALMAEMRGAPRSEAARRAVELIERLQLEEWADRPLRNVSGGTARLVGFCFAAAQPGRVVVLDEPTNDVDPLRRRLLWHVVRDLADGGSAVLLVTHNVLEAQNAVDRVAIVNHGRLIASGTPNEVRRGRDNLRLDLRHPIGAALVLPSFMTIATTQTARLVAHLPANSAEDAIRWCQDHQERHLIEEFALGPVTLEDVYLDSVGEDAA